MEEWKTDILENLLDALIDYRGKTPRKTAYGVPLVTAKIIKGGSILPYEEYIAEEDYDAWMVRGFSQPGDVVMTTEAPLGEAAVLDNRKVALAQRVVTLRGKQGILDSTYLKYFLQSAIGQSRLSARETGTTVTGIKQSELRKVDISYPSFQTQRRISAILKSLDDKIALNNRINHNLEEQAQALYKSWFVDFEPFKDGNFVESELGMIPEGWQVKNLLEISQLFDSKRKPLSGKERDQMSKIYPYYGATSIMDYVDSYIFDGTYLLMGEDGSVMTDDGYPFLQYVTGKFWPNNHAHVLQGNNGFSTEMLHCALLRKVVKSSVTGAVQAKISQANMKKILFPCPPSVNLKDFDCQLQTIYCQKRNIEAQNADLALLRDSMLPMLMSGQITC